jgi:hypothetical protein
MLYLNLRSARARLEGWPRARCGLMVRDGALRLLTMKLTDEVIE